MIKKYSKALIIPTIEFIRAAKAEVGNALGEEQINSLLDAFDPALKAQVFMELLIGNIGIIHIQRDQTFYSQQKKITAIKAVRRVAGIGLKEAKDIVDGCHDQAVLIEGNFSAVQQADMRAELLDTGYKIV